MDSGGTMDRGRYSTSDDPTDDAEDDTVDDMAGPHCYVSVVT